MSGRMVSNHWAASMGALLNRGYVANPGVCVYLMKPISLQALYQHTNRILSSLVEQGIEEDFPRKRVGVKASDYSRHVGTGCPSSGNWGASMAERVGFEPTVPFRTTVFETVRIGHSRTSPYR